MMNSFRWVASLLAIFMLSSLALAQPGGTATNSKVAAALPELDRLAQQLLKKTGVPGMAIAVVHKDQVVHLKGYGVREVGQAAVVDADTVFQLASVSKPLAATVLSALVGEGVVQWDDRVIDHNPAFRMFDPWVTRELTLRDLLCHRSGLADHAGDLLEDLGYGRAEVLHRLRFEKPAISFRSEFAYTNFGFTEGCLAGAKATAMNWEELAAAKLFRPLGMTSSSYRHADYAAAPNRARLHVRTDDGWVAKYTRQPDAQSPAGGASSSARDLARWLRLLLAEGNFEGKPIIAAKALAETHRPQIVSHPPANANIDRAGFYGLGWNVNYDEAGRVRLGHSGAFAMGAATAVSLLPAEDLGIVVITNAVPIGVPETICASFLDLVLLGKTEKDWFAFMTPIFATLAKPEYGAAVNDVKPPAKPSSKLADSAYVGTYGNEYYGNAEVATQDGGLVLKLGPQQTAYELRHWDRDVFTYQPTGENATVRSAVTFLIGPDVKATRVVVENLDLRSQGAFTR